MKIDRDNCGFDELMVAYIYDEASSIERRRFEGHLLDCVRCTDEFALLSNARLSVFEWQKEDFADLATPHFEIPYERTNTVIENDATGWLAKLQGVFSGLGFPVAAAAGVLVVLGLGFAAVMLLNAPQPEIAANIEVERPVVEKQPIEAPSVITAPVPTAAPVNLESEYEVESEPVPAKAVKVKRPKASRPAVTQTAERSVSPTRTPKAPALNDFEDLDDRSLRLTDLFEGEIGGVY